jgi:hypothetical protein
MNPERSVISGERAPKNAANVVKAEAPPEDSPTPPNLESPDLIVALKSGKRKNVNVIINIKNDSTLNVSEAAARFSVVSAIVLHQ